MTNYATVHCEYCGRPFRPERDRARYCSNAHKQAAYRRRKAGTAVVLVGSDEQAVRLKTLIARLGG